MEPIKKTRNRFSAAILWVFFLMTFASVSLGPNLDLSFNPSGGVTVEAAETRITNASVNLRTGPGTGYAIILTIPKGSLVTVSGYSGNWAKVTYGTKSGYAYAAYLSAVEPGTTSRWTTTNLNFRTGPGTSYSIIEQLPRDTEVTFNYAVGSWSAITYKGTSGYASSAYLAKAIKYTTIRLNLRSGPGTGYSIILTMPKDSKVYVFSTAGGWSKIKYDSYSGYASDTFLAGVTPLPPPPPPPDPDPEPELPGIRLISHGLTSASGKRIALSFDDQGDATHVRSILATLKEYGAHSTFFPLGEWIDANPKLAQEIVSQGHEIQSHSYNHVDLNVKSAEVVRQQLLDSINTIKDKLGYAPKLLRPPYGSYNDDVIRIAGELGFAYVVIWSVDSHDWADTMSGQDVTVDYVVNRVVSNATTNGIVCLHMWPDKTLEALPRILEALRDQGYSFVTISQMVP